MTTAIQGNTRLKHPFSPQPSPSETLLPDAGIQVSTFQYLCPLVPIPANWVPGPKQGEWTYDAYAKIPGDGQRYEVIEGVLYLMSAPSIKHQKVLNRINQHLYRFVEGTERGDVLIAPCDVELDPNNVFQPDVLVILNEHLGRETETRIVGAPDLVVEVLSPSTKSQDRGPKQAVYARAGVSEYWIVDPKQETIEVLSLAGQRYHDLGTFSGPALIQSLVLPDFSLKAEQCFPRQKEPILVGQETSSTLDAKMGNSIATANSA
jgi:Uma2 family endonuclease